MGCGKKCAKYTLVVFNILFWLSGLALIIIGAIYATNPSFSHFNSFVSPDDPMLVTGMYVLIGIGCFIFIFGFCGCCGAIKESRCLLGVYIVLMVIVMAAELGVGIYIAVKKTEVENKAISEMVQTIQTRYPVENATTNEGATFKTAVDNIQQVELKCCGISGPSDWNSSMWYNGLTAAQKASGYQTPRSCCTDGKAMTDSSIYATCQTTNAYYMTGCWTEVQNWITKNFPIIIGVGCGIAFLEILGLICAIVLCKKVDDDDDQYV